MLRASASRFTCFLFVSPVRCRFGFHTFLKVTSSASSGSALVVGAKACGYRGQVLGISVDKTGGHLRDTVMDLLPATAERLDLDLAFAPSDMAVDDRFLGGGYGVVTEAEREAIRLVARREGILLDPVYTGKAMAGLLAHIRQGEIGAGERWLFWHTGGIPALFADATSLLRG